MLQLSLNQLSPAEFLSQYWQKKPLLIRQGFENFKDFYTYFEDFVCVLLLLSLCAIARLRRVAYLTT